MGEHRIYIVIPNLLLKLELQFLLWFESFEFKIGLIILLIYFINLIDSFNMTKFLALLRDLQLYETFQLYKNSN